MQCDDDSGLPIVSGNADDNRPKERSISYSSTGLLTFAVPPGVRTIRLFGCGGGDGGRPGVASIRSQTPGPGGAGGNGSVAFFATEGGRVDIPVNDLDVFEIRMGVGGGSGMAGTPTIFKQIEPPPPGGTKARQYTWGAGLTPSTRGGQGSGAGRDKSVDGQAARDGYNAYVPGGAGIVTFRGNQDKNWGGSGGGGGAGILPGGAGGRGGCDGGSEIGYPGGTGNAAFKASHAGKAGAPGQGYGAGGGGGGGGGDVDKDGGVAPGGPGGKGGDGYLEVQY